MTSNRKDSGVGSVGNGATKTGRKRRPRGGTHGQSIFLAFRLSSSIQASAQRRLRKDTVSQRQPIHTQLGDMFFVRVWTSSNDALLHVPWCTGVAGGTAQYHWRKHGHVRKISGTVSGTSETMVDVAAS